MHEVKQIFYIAAVIIVMIVAVRYMRKIKDLPDDLPEDPEQALSEEEEVDEEEVTIDETAD